MTELLDCNHELIDRYDDGAAECALCGTELGVAGLMLKHLGIERIEDEESNGGEDAN